MRKVWLMLGIGLLLLGCGEEHEDLKNWMAEQAKDMRPKLMPLPKLETFPSVDYDAAALVDPFQASRLEPEKRPGARGANAPDPNRRREPLEAYPLESLRMVGQMMMNGRPVALIQADKTIYQVKAGNYMGQNFGLVTKISETEVVLKELIEDANGDWVGRESTIQLQEPEAKK